MSTDKSLEALIGDLVGLVALLGDVVQSRGDRAFYVSVRPSCRDRMFSLGHGGDPAVPGQDLGNATANRIRGTSS
jgi:hypothetical protein